MVLSEDIEVLERRAAEDLTVAEILLDSDEELLAQIGFHLQQFIEKKMKASLRRQKIDYPKTHDLILLLKLFPCKRVSEDDEIFAHILSLFAVESRYGICSEPPMDGRQMLEEAKKFAELIETLWNDL